MERKINNKNLLFKLVFAALCAAFLNSCNIEVKDNTEVKKFAKTNSANSDIKYNFVDEIHYIRNPETGYTQIFKGDGTILLKSDDCASQRVDIIEDVKTKKASFMYKTYIGETFVEQHFGGDGYDYVNKYPSERTEIYNLDGTKLDIEISSFGPKFSFGDNIIYYSYNQDANNNGLRVYNVTTKEKKNLHYNSCEYYAGHLILSQDNYSFSDNTDRRIDVVDDELNIIKTINGYTIVDINKYGNKEILKVVKNNVNVTNDYDNYLLYNYLDYDLKLIFDKDVENSVYESKEPIVTFYRDNIEFDFDFENMKIVGEERPHIPDSDDWRAKEKERALYKTTSEELKNSIDNCSYIDTRIYNKKVLFFVHLSNDSGVYSGDSCDIYNENKEFLIHFDDVNSIDDDLGRIQVDGNTFYDFDIKLIKKVDGAKKLISFDKLGKKYYYDEQMSDDNINKPINLYDSDFNILLNGIIGIDSYSYDDLLVVNDGKCTKIIDMNMKEIKKFDKSYTIQNWYRYGVTGITEVKYNLGDLANENNNPNPIVEGLKGLIDEKYNIIITGLKNIEDVREHYFTYQNGFKYGLMDYKGKVLISFSIFDSLNEDYLNPIDAMWR